MPADGGRRARVIPGPTGLERLLAALHDGGVAFILVGGVAARAHGSARLTQDVDIAYARDDDNVDRLASALRPLRPYLRGAPPGLVRVGAEQQRADRPCDESAPEHDGRAQQL